MFSAASVILLGLLATLTSATYGPGERCRGAPGYPAVEWRNPPCENGAKCDVPDPEYGYRCGAPNPDYSCYNTGERAQGAPGYPAVPWKPCCDADAEQISVDDDWGKFCVVSGEGSGTGVDSCYKKGERAQGAPGYPAVPWKPCCDADAEQISVDGDWGKFCVVDQGIDVTNTTGEGPFPELAFTEFSYVAPNTKVNGKDTLGGPSSAEAGAAFSFTYSGEINSRGVVSLDDADKVVTAVDCNKGGTLRVRVNPDFNTGATLQEMYPPGALLVVNADVYGDCDLVAEDVEVDTNSTTGEPISGYIYIDAVSGTVHDAEISGRVGTYFDIFQEADFLFAPEVAAVALPEDSRAGLLVSRQSADTVLQREITVELPSVLSLTGSLQVKNKGDLELLKAKWSLTSGTVDIEIKLSVEYEAVAAMTMKASTGVSIRTKIADGPKIPLYGFKIPKLSVGGKAISGLDLGLFFEAPIIFGAQLELEKELVTPVTATLNSGRKEVVFFARGPFSDVDIGAQFPVDNPATLDYNVPSLQQAIVEFVDAPITVGGSLYLGVQPGIVARVSILFARVSVDAGVQLEIKGRLDGPAFPPTDEGTIGVCDSCHKRRVEVSRQLDKFGFVAGLSIPWYLKFVVPKISLQLPFSLQDNLFTACVIEEFGDSTEVCGSGSSAICCDSAVPGQVCSLDPAPTCSETTTPPPTTEETVTAGIGADPHLRTFDRLGFDCQASGEFELARATTSGLMLQGRFSGPDSSGSVLTGIALEVGGAPRIQVSTVVSPGNATSGACPLRIFANGELQAAESASFGANATVSIDVGPRVTITAPSGVVVKFRPRRSSTFGCYMEAMSVSLPASVASEVSGLLGPGPNGDRTDDWQTQDGTVVQLPESSADRLFEAAYEYCTSNWCIKDADSSIFSYEDGQSHASFAFCDRAYVRPDLSSASPELLELCRGRQECLVDGVVGGIDDATASIDALAEIEELQSVGESNATLPGNLNGTVLVAQFTWIDKGDLDTSASWLGAIDGFLCGAETTFIKWSDDDTSSSGSETYTLDLVGSLAEGAWNGSTEIRFGAGWFAETTSLGPATLRISLQIAETGEDVAGAAVERDVSPGVQSGCASENEVAVAKISEGANGFQLSVEGAAFQ